MLKNINVSVAPHIKSKRTTASIMLDVCIALLFPLAAGVYAYGISALITILLCMVPAFYLSFYSKSL